MVWVVRWTARYMQSNYVDKGKAAVHRERRELMKQTKSEYKASVYIPLLQAYSDEETRASKTPSMQIRAMQ